MREREETLLQTLCCSSPAAAHLHLVPRCESRRVKNEVKKKWGEENTALPAFETRPVVGPTLFRRQQTHTEGTACSSNENHSDISTSS